MTNKITWVAHRVRINFQHFFISLNFFFILINGRILFARIGFVTAESAQVHFDSVVWRGERARKSYRPVWESGAISSFHPSTEYPGNYYHLSLNSTLFKSVFLLRKLIFIIFSNRYICKRHLKRKKSQFEENYIANTRSEIFSTFDLIIFIISSSLRSFLVIWKMNSGNTVFLAQQKNLNK